MNIFLELPGNFPYRGLPPLYLRKSARFLGQCVCITVLHIVLSVFKEACAERFEHIVPLIVMNVCADVHPYLYSQMASSTNKRCALLAQAGWVHIQVFRPHSKQAIDEIHAVSSSL
jgi:hypothetical protein